MIRIFKALVPISALALMFGDLILIISSYLLATAWVTDLDIGFVLQYQSGSLHLAEVVIVLFVSFYFQDFYSRSLNRSITTILQQIGLSIGIVFLFQALLSFINPELVSPQRIMIIGSILAMVSVLGWHLLIQVTLGNATSSSCVIFLGASPAVFELAGHLKANPALGLLPAGYIEQSPVEHSTIPWLGPADRCLEIVETHEPSWIIIGRPERLLHWWVDDFLELRFGGVQVEYVEELFEESLSRISIKQLRPSDLAQWNPAEPDMFTRLQGTIGTITAIVLIVLLSPVLAAIAILSKISSKGQVLTRTQVTGRYGRLFSLYRFRCTTELGRVRQTTALGSILQRLKLDGLPQLFNIAVGDLAFIGPKPHRVEFSHRFNQLLPFYPHRHSIKPGLVGWTDLKGSPSDDSLRMLEYDLYYVKNAFRRSITTADLLVLAGLIKKPWQLREIISGSSTDQHAHR